MSLEECKVPHKQQSCRLLGALCEVLCGRLSSVALGGVAHLQSGATDRQLEADVEPMTDSKLSTAGGQEQRACWASIESM